MMASSIRILIYSKDLHGGTGRFIECLQQELNTYKISSRVITHTLTKTLSLKSIQVGKASSKFNKLSIFSIKNAVHNIFVVRKYIQEYQPDIIFSLDIYANIMTILLRPFTRKYKLIQSTNINLVDHIREERTKAAAALLWIILRIVYRFADKHIVPSSELLNQVIQKLHLPITMVSYYPYFISVKHYQELSDVPISKKTLPVRNSNTIRIFSMGRFEKQKDFKQLLHAAKHSYKKKVEFYILGGGSQRQELVDFCKENQITNVHFLGWQQNPFKFLKLADIFILLTRFEAFPYSLLEALSLSLPVIVSDVDFGPRELLQNNKYGLLLRDNKTKTIERTIELLINNVHLRKQLKKESVKRAEDFDTKKIFPNYLKLFGITNNGPNAK